MSGSDWGRHSSKSCCNAPLGYLAVSTAWQISRGPATSSTTGVWNVLCHNMSIAQEVMREECDIHHTRSIKTNSAANLSRKPGLDLCCCDLLQHLQGVPRTCSFYKIMRTSILLVPSPKLSSVWNVTRSNSRIIWMQFCFIMFNMQQYHAHISYPSLYAGYLVSVHRMVMDNIVLEKSSCWPW